MIMKMFKKFPAGSLIIPMFLLAIINSFAPFLLNGSMVGAVFSSKATATVLGLCLVCMGAQLKVTLLLKVLKRGGVLLVSKFIVGAAIGLIVGKVFGMAGIFGISSLAIICAVTNSNTGIYYALVSDVGDDVDAATSPLLTLNDGPFFTLLVLGASNMATIPLSSMIDILIPLLVGMILGNLDDSFAAFLQGAQPALMVFLGCALGAGINLKDIVSGGVSGILLGLVTVFVGGGFIVLCDRVISKRPGYAGWALATTGGNAVAVPAAIALVDPSIEPFVASATMQTATSVIVSVILVPIITVYWAKKFGSPKYPLNSEE